MSPLIAIAATVLPDILRLLAADKTGTLGKTIESIVIGVTGAKTPEQAQKDLDASPALSAELREKLAAIELDSHRADLAAEGAATEADLSFNAAQLNNTENARQLLIELTEASKSTSYTPPVLSYIVVIGFFGVLFSASSGALNKLSPQTLHVVYLLFGALTTAFATILNFWLGSSFGSRRKDATAATSEAIQHLKQLGGGPIGTVPARSGPTSGGSTSSGGAPSGGGIQRVASDGSPPSGESADNLPEDNNEEDIDEKTLQGSLSVLQTAPAQLPHGDPVPFAQSRTPVSRRAWPVRTNLPSGRVVSFETVSGSVVGAPGRRFLAARNGGARIHVGLDVYAERNDEVVACEDGRIVNFYPFYRTSKGDMSYALFIEHNDFVINYGEVAATSRKDFGWSIGDHVKSGQPIGTISGTAMLHFETYRLGTKTNIRWLPKQPRPTALLNPTLYLLQMAAPGPVA